MKVVQIFTLEVNRTSENEEDTLKEKGRKTEGERLCIKEIREIIYRKE